MQRRVVGVSSCQTFRAPLVPGPTVHRDGCRRLDAGSRTASKSNAEACRRTSPSSSRRTCRGRVPEEDRGTVGPRAGPSSPAAGASSSRSVSTDAQRASACLTARVPVNRVVEVVALVCPARPIACRRPSILGAACRRCAAGHPARGARSRRRAGTRCSTGSRRAGAEATITVLRHSNHAEGGSQPGGSAPGDRVTALPVKLRPRIGLNPWTFEPP